MDFDSIIECSIHSGGTTKPTGNHNAQRRNKAMKSAPTVVSDGGMPITKRNLLHGPWPPTVYNISTDNGEEIGKPVIIAENWKHCGTYGETHPWLVRSCAAFNPRLICKYCGWVADKESLRPQLIKALRTWHTKLSEDLAEAEKALVDAMFKPL